MKTLEKKLIYENTLESEADIADFRIEGSSVLSFPNGRLRMQNSLSSDLGQKSNFVLWCIHDFPSDIEINWDFWPISEPGLCILFFAAKGINGEDLFDPKLKLRSGEYDMYHHGDINAFHVSYFRRKWPEERSFHTCNLRKSYGFNMVCQGADPIPSVIDSNPPYHIKVKKLGAEISFYINELQIFKWMDDGKSYGPCLTDGKIGFRQMAPLIAEYANLKIYSIE